MLPPTPNHSGGPDDAFKLHLPPDAGAMSTVGESAAVLVDMDFACLPAREIDVATPLQYLERVRTTFGSLETYLAWRDTSNLLLDRKLPDGTSLRSQINLSFEEQRVFFYWVSWGYHKNGRTPDQIVTLIAAGITPQLKKAVSDAEKELGAKIPIQGFCPRPQRDDAHYKLGTMSEHGFGQAVDIEPDLNPIVVGKLWKAIEAAIGRKPDRSQARWEREPDAMFDDLDAFCSEWVELVEAHVDVERRAPAPAREGLVPHQPPRVAGDPNLYVRVIRRLLHTEENHARMLAELPRLRFLNHPRARVLALRDQGLVWGATFDNVDLHHFEIASKALKPWERTRSLRAPRRTDADFDANLEP